MTSTPLPVGVVGVGSLGFHHARLYAGDPAVRLAGVYDDDAARARDVAARLGTVAYPSLAALLDAVTAVSVVVPTAAHHAVGIAALRHGRHVLMEKPLAATIVEAEALVALADARGVVLQAGHVERFNRALRAAAPYLERPLYVESDRVAPFDPRGSDVPVILDLMIHDIDLVLSLVREPVAEVRASGVGIVTPSADIASARLEFASGAVANLTASRLARERVRRLRIFQSTGYLSLDLAAGSGAFLRLRRGALARLAGGAGAPGLDDVVETIPLTAPDAEPLALELANFTAAVRGEAEPASSGADGLEALRVAFQVLDAMGAGAAAGAGAGAPR